MTLREFQVHLNDGKSIAIKAERLRISKHDGFTYFIEQGKAPVLVKTELIVWIGPNK